MRHVRMRNLIYTGAHISALLTDKVADNPLVVIAESLAEQREPAAVHCVFRHEYAEFDLFPRLNFQIGKFLFGNLDPANIRALLDRKSVV